MDMRKIEIETSPEDFFPRVVEKRYTGHTHWVRSVIFIPEKRLIVSAGNDKSVRVWDLESGKCLVRFQQHVHVVRFLLKWNSSEFLSCGADGAIYSYSLDSLEVLCKILSYKHEGYKFVMMKKISQELFICISHGRKKILIINYKKKTIERKLNPKSLHFGSMVLVSSKFPTMIYLSCGSNFSKAERNCVRMIDYEKDTVIDEMEELNKGVQRICIYNNREEEILVILTNNSMAMMNAKLLFFNTTKNLLRECFMEVDCCYTKITFISTVLDRYIFLGTKSSNCEILVLDIKRDFKTQIYKGGMGIGNGIYDIHPLYDGRKDKLRVLLGTSKKDVLLVALEGISHDHLLDDEDTIERISYLQQSVINMNDVSFENCPFMIHIKVTGCFKFYIFKSILHQ